MTTTPPDTTAQGDEVHPSYGVVNLSRVTAQPGVRLFDSSIPHTEFVSMSISGATRQRSLHHDWIFSDHAPKIVVEMTMTQWGALVSSFGQGSGTPVTLRRVNGEDIPYAPNPSRLAETAREVAEAAEHSTSEVRTAVQAVVEAFENKAGRRELGALINNLHHTADNLPRNMKYAANTLTRHAEDVVSKANADIEAARQFGSTPLPAGTPVPELEAGQ